MNTATLIRLAALSAVMIQAAILPQLGADEPQNWTFTWHTSEVTDLAFTPDGTKLITTSLRDDRISWIVSGEDHATSTGDSAGVVTGARSHTVAVSPDGTRAAVAGFRITSMHDLTMPRELWNISTLSDEYSPPFVVAVAFSPDGRQLATSGRGSKSGGRHGYNGGLITIRNAKSGEEIHQYDDLPHASESIAFSPDGKLFAAGTAGASGELPEPGELRIWDTSDWKLLHVWKAKDSIIPGKNQCSVTGIAFNPDSSSIALAISDGTVRLWDVATRKPRAELKGHRGAVRRVAFSPNGRLLASAGIDRTVRVWDAATGQQTTSFDVKASKINALSFSPDGSLLAAGGGDFLRMGEVRMWKLQDSDHE